MRRPALVAALVLDGRPERVHRRPTPARTPAASTDVADVEHRPAAVPRAAATDGRGGSDLLPALSFDCLGRRHARPGRAPRAMPTVLNLWGSWCAPCRDELPLMQQLADAAGGRCGSSGVISKDGRPQADVVRRGRRASRSPARSTATAT